MKRTQEAWDRYIASGVSPRLEIVELFNLCRSLEEELNQTIPWKTAVLNACSSRYITPSTPDQTVQTLLRWERESVETLQKLQAP